MDILTINKYQFSVCTKHGEITNVWIKHQSTCITLHITMLPFLLKITSDKLNVVLICSDNTPLIDDRKVMKEKASGGYLLVLFLIK